MTATAAKANFLRLLDEAVAGESAESSRRTTCRRRLLLIYATAIEHGVKLVTKER